MGDKFLPYQSANNNCQIFIMGVLSGNGLNNSERTSFVKQDTKSIFKNNPVLRKFANTLTDIGGYANAIVQSVDLHKNTKNKKSIRETLEMSEPTPKALEIKAPDAEIKTEPPEKKT